MTLSNSLVNSKDVLPTAQPKSKILSSMSFPSSFSYQNSDLEITSSQIMEHTTGNRGT